MAKKKKALAVTTRLEQFATSFRDETELRLALISLLERLPNTKGIRHTHGTGELGKDIVFTSSGPFARDELVACVVKNDRITGIAESRTGARTVYIQADQCLDTEILNHKGVLEGIARVFVITPYECSPTSIASIAGKLGKPDGVVRFIFGRELFELFEQHYPDYLLFRSGLFGSYVADLEKGLADDTAIANVLIRHGLAGSNDEVKRIYVQPAFSQKISAHKLDIRKAKLSLLRSVTEIDVILLGNRLRGLVRFFYLVGPPSERKPFDSVVVQFARDLRKAWQTSFERVHRPSIKTSDTQVRRTAQVDLLNFDEFESRLSALLERPLKLVHDFEIEMARANEFALGGPLSFEHSVKHPYATNYSFVAGISRQIPNLVNASTEIRAVTCSSDELLSTGFDFLITAPAGFGKTSFCKWNVLRDLKMLKEQRSSYIPVYIPLHHLTGIRASSPEHLFLSFAGLKALWETRNKEGQTRNFRFYLDGLDEVPNEVDQKELIDLAMQLKQSAPDSQIILTGREHVAGAHLKGFLRVHVSEMSENQLAEFIQTWFAGDCDKVTTFNLQLAQLGSLNQVMRAPLLATLVLSVYSSTGTVPESRARLYDMFISLMAGGWDVAKHVQRDTQFGPQPKITVLQSLAGRLQLGAKRDASAFEFGEAVKAQLPALIEKRDVLLTEIIHDGLLVPVGDHYAFSHLSFQEYLAAKDLMEPTGKKAAIALSAYLRGQDWWREVLGFYVTLSDQPKAMEAFVRDTVEKVAKRLFDDQIVPRAHHLLEEIVMAYPGCNPDFDFPRLGGLTRSLFAEYKYQTVPTVWETLVPVKTSPSES